MPFIFTKYAKYVSLLIIGLLFPLILFLYNARTQFLYKDNTLSIMKGDVRTFDTDALIKKSLQKDIWVVVLVECDDIFDIDSYRTYSSMADDLYNMPNNYNMIGLSNILVPAMIENGKLKPRFELLVPDKITLEKINWKQVREKALETSYIKNLIMSEDMKSSVTLCLFEDSINTKFELDAFVSKINNVIDKYRSDKFKIYTVGVPIIKKELQDSLLDNLLSKGLLGLLGVLVCLWFVCRKIRLMFNLIICIVMNLAFCLFLCYSFNLHFDYFLALLIPIVLAVQLTFLIHFYIVLQRKSRESNDESFYIIVEQALNEVIKPSLTACLTTVAGFLSFTFSDIQELVLFGQCGAIASLISIFISYGPGVSLLIFFSPDHVGKIKSIKERISLWPFILNKKVGLISGVICIFCFVFSIASFKDIKTDERAIQYLPESSQIRYGLETMSERFGGVHVFKVELDTGGSGGLNSSSTLSIMARLHKKLINIEGISAVYSYASVISEVHKKMTKAINATPFSFLSKPLSSGELVDDMSVPSGIGILFINTILQKYNPRGLSLLADTNRQKGTLIIRTVDMPTAEFVVLMAKAMAVIEKEDLGIIKSKLMKDKNDYLIKEKQIQKSLLDSYLYSVLPIFLLLCILFRTIGWSFMAIFCNGISIVLMLGLLTKLNFVLNSITVMAGSIAFSIAIDDSIHLIKSFQRLALKHTNAEAIKICYAQKGRAVLGTSFLICSVALFLAAIDFPPISNFGWLLFSAILIALFVNLFILPLGFWVSGIINNKQKNIIN
ncbi:MAG: hypothetical protein COA79_12250 [Planctomycetota bacterium]|nr:MAG: hypothetical protein COA79_12250 [Planctomycetota bacterium]